MPGEIEAFICAVSRDEVGETSIAAFLMGFLSKGISARETEAIARAMMAHYLPVRPRVTEDLLDTCGTGGGLSTFNISTATAIVCAAAGIPVAKHGSRSLHSPSGSADVLEALGVVIDLPVPAIERMIEEIGIAFIHAPNFHPVMRRLLPVEAALGIKTIFYTLIGPLISPARAQRHLLGVFREDWQAMTAEVLRNLGMARAMVVHGLDGLDEISLLGPTRIHDLGPGGTSVYEIAPEDFGLARCRLEDIGARGPQGNAELLRQVFSGQERGAPRDAITLNSAGALIISGRAADFAEGIALAAELIDSGAVARKLGEMVEASHAFGDRLARVQVDESRRLHTAERIWHGILAASPDGIVLLGREGMVEQANAQACVQLGLAAEQIVDHSYAQLLDAATAQPRLQKIAEAFSSGQALRWEDSSGAFHYGLTAIPVDDGSGLVLICRDLSEQVRAAASEQDKRARLKTLIETLPDLIWLSDANGNLLNCNHKFERLIGVTESQIKGRALRDFLPRELADTLKHGAAQVLSNNIPALSRQWLVFADDNHQEYVEIIQTPFIDQQGVIKGVMGVARDVTAFQHKEDELRRQKTALRKMLYTDDLTGLPSRQAQIERIQALAAGGSSFSIISISLNNFSRIFSNFGSSMSDAVIAATATALGEAIPGHYELYRSADIRFSMIAVNVIDPAMLASLANRIIEHMSRPLHIGDASIFVNVSIGMASYPIHGPNTDQLIRNTIAALNEAEQIDGMAFRLFTPTMLESVQHLQWLDHNLRLALEQGQFELHYQPKVDLADRTTSSVEALIRWIHPERGNIRPDEFIGRCESNGLIIPLGRWIIDTAAHQAAEWRAQGRPVRIAINVSVKQLADSELLNKLREAQAHASGLLDIELTESCLMSHQDAMLELIQQCRELGFGVHLDDFGTGYSSLSVLARLPLTKIKLDRVFVHEIGKTGNGQAILKSMIGMAKELQLSVVAEGVETEEQAEFLRGQGVTLAQGWLYAPAMSVEKFNLWFSPESLA
ncbi:anthranilate phosphoribosyltransferase [Pseudomonas sp. J452]|nr:anthranilate phosphoribosyltransferase [Pseudomonas sp. J452]